MRSIVLVALLVVLGLGACGDRNDRDGACVYNGMPYSLDDVFPAGDNCNSCTCTMTGAVCTARVCGDAGVDADPLSCGASGGCPDSPACGAFCCKNGERCVAGTCQCGGRPACGTGDLCEAPGPIGMDRCGSICCGVSGPCPQ
jgi:hypothetical protein